MKPEIKSDNDYIYHYDREERLKKLSICSSLRKPKEGFLKRNRSVILIFINMVLIYIVFGLVYPKIENPKLSIKNSGNYTFSIDGFEYDGNIFITLSVKKTIDGKKNSNPEAKVEIIYANDNSLSFVIPLPEKLNEKAAVARQIKKIGTFTDIKAKIFNNKKFFYLTINTKTN